MSEELKIILDLMTDEQAAKLAVDTGNKAMMAAVGRRMMERSEVDKCRALLHAGWLPLFPFDDAMPYQWQWRAPTKRVGKPGRKYLSTSQAFNAMEKKPC